MTRPIHLLSHLICAAALLLAAASDAEPISLAGPESQSALAGIEGHAEGGTVATTHTVLTWSDPPVTGRRYLLHGVVRYEEVEGAGYLEMWSHFGGEGSYFSRTLADAGPLGRLSGSSTGRAFALPFDTGDSGLVPQRIELNIVLPGPGRVVVSELRWSGDDGGAATTTPTGAETPAALGAVGAALGTALGLLGALVGVLGGRGRARGLVMGALGLIVAIASVAAGAALWGLVAGRPAGELVPLACVGVVGLSLVAFGLPVLRRRYADAELRKMRALDLDTRPLVPRS